MEVLSRVEKNKTKKRGPIHSLNWFVWIIIYGAILYGYIKYISLPDSLPFLQTLEISLFFCSILFLDLYLLAFTFVSTKDFLYKEEKVAKAKLWIISVWVISLLYHFVLWLMTYSTSIILYYQCGIGFTLAALILTLGHFFSYFSFISRSQIDQGKTKIWENRRKSYEVIKKVLYMYQVVQDVMFKDPEVQQMMKWNRFDGLMDQLIQEVQPFVQATHFTREDLEKLLGAQAWMENMLAIISQHPDHRNFSK